MRCVTCNYEIKGIRFDRIGEGKQRVAVARGVATVAGAKHLFELALAPIEDGVWRSVQFAWLDGADPLNDDGLRDFLLRIVNVCARLLDTINLWPHEQTGRAAQLSANQRVIPDDVRDKVLISFRSGILKVPSIDWKYCWDRIERRVDSDPYFEVLGFDREAVVRVLPALKQVFPESWVRARYEDAGHTSMADQLGPEDKGWFPAYHLARTAHGAICRDPGWNYLVEIGLALDALKDFDGIEQLRRQLARSPGTQHHLCLAADLNARGMLLGLEPTAGNGAATNDLLVGVAEVTFQVEVKEFGSQKPRKQLEKEIADKARKLPAKPAHPVVFHVVLLENGFFEKTRDDDFFCAVAELGEKLPDQISAVVGSKRFVDSKGGRVKRTLEQLKINQSALNPIRRATLDAAFGTDDGDVTYPLYGIGTFFVFGNTQ